MKILQPNYRFFVTHTREIAETKTKKLDSKKLSRDLIRTAFGLPFHLPFQSMHCIDTRNLHENSGPDKTHDIVRILNWHGAVMLGSTSCNEFVRGKGITYNKGWNMSKSV